MRVATERRRLRGFAGGVAGAGQFGWKLRLEVGELFWTQVCRSTEEILDMQESRKAALIQKSWAV